MSQIYLGRVQIWFAHALWPPKSRVVEMREILQSVHFLHRFVVEGDEHAHSQLANFRAPTIQGNPVGEIAKNGQTTRNV